MTTEELDRLEAEFADAIGRLDAQTGGNPIALFRERVVIDYELRSVARRALAAAREPLDVERLADGILAAFRLEVMRGGVDQLYSPSQMTSMLRQVVESQVAALRKPVPE